MGYWDENRLSAAQLKTWVIVGVRTQKDLKFVMLRACGRESQVGPYDHIQSCLPLEITCKQTPLGDKVVDFSDNFAARLVASSQKSTMKSEL